MRILNKIANGFPYELIFEISPFAAKYLRQLVKLPMILILNVCGIQTGINLVTFTFLGELLKSGTFTESIGLILFLGAIAAFSSVFLLFTLNFINSRYDQLDTLPIYQSMNMIYTIICGLIFLNEVEDFKTIKFIILWIAIGVVVWGILLLGFKKTRLLKTEEEKISQVSAAAASQVHNDNEESKLIEENNDLAEVFEDNPIIVIDQNELKLLRMLTEQKGQQSSEVAKEEEKSD